jgi:hypothetical protein
VPQVRFLNLGLGFAFSFLGSEGNSAAERRDVPETIYHHTVSPNSQIPANRLNPFHFPVSRSNDIHSIIAIDSNENSCYFVS